MQNDCRSIAFPLISSGIYGYPIEQALQIAVAAISEFLLKYDIQVYLLLYDQQTFELSKKLFPAGEANSAD
jgi:O-acetyl-ADP-ribose deacetylase (regulator of RNase III)